jgi:hypothetical protein
MANLVRNDLAIEGDNIKTVLDAIGFNPKGVTLVSNAKVQPENIAVLINFDRIVQRPKEPPVEGWDEWVTKNWGALPYDGYADGDIFELTEDKASFKFYTKWTSAFFLIETLAKRFPEFTFHLRNWEQTNHLNGEAAWRNGMRTLFVPMFGMKVRDDADEPGNDPVTDEIKAKAAHLVKAAARTCNGCTPDTHAAESMVAGVMAASGGSVTVNFEPNDDGSCCLYIEA